MRKRIRILAGVALVGAVAFVSAPVSASHDDPPGTSWPWGPHQEQPEPKSVAEPNLVCAVTGGITTPPYAPGGPDHAIVIPEVNDDPSHSHYTVLDTAIICGDVSELTVEIFDVTATGGDDGHIVDLDDTNGDPIELDCVDSVLPGDVDPGTKPGCTDDDHSFNWDHGSVNESAWSHSSDYAPGVPPGVHDFGQCNDWPVPVHANKGNITATGTLSKIGPNEGWVKYLRVGPVVHAWGSFYSGPYAANKGGCVNFSAELLFTPTGTAPGSPFLLNGTAEIGTGWTPLT